jgi:serine/threonine-protein kinase TTK/MPS1
MELGTGDLDQMIKVMAANKARHSMASGSDTFMHSRDRKFVWRQIVSCVKSLHMNNIINTDLKPGNFITFGQKIKLTDLGLALRADEPK